MRDSRRVNQQTKVFMGENENKYQDYPIVNVKYETDKGQIFENYYLTTEKAKNFFYARFVKEHLNNSREFYPHLGNVAEIKKMIYEHEINTPKELICYKNKHGQYMLVKKIFSQAEESKMTV